MNMRLAIILVGAFIWLSTAVLVNAGDIKVEGVVEIGADTILEAMENFLPVKDSMPVSKNVKIPFADKFYEIKIGEIKGEINKVIEVKIKDDRVKMTLDGICSFKPIIDKVPEISQMLRFTVSAKLILKKGVLSATEFEVDELPKQLDVKPIVIPCLGYKLDLGQELRNYVNLLIKDQFDSYKVFDIREIGQNPATFEKLDIKLSSVDNAVQIKCKGVIPVSELNKNF